MFLTIKLYCLAWTHQNESGMFFHYNLASVMYPINHQLLRILVYMISLICSFFPPLPLSALDFHTSHLANCESLPAFAQFNSRNATNNSFSEESSKDTILPSNSFTCFKKSLNCLLSYNFQGGRNCLISVLLCTVYHCALTKVLISKHTEFTWTYNSPSQLQAFVPTVN